MYFTEEAKSEIYEKYQSKVFGYLYGKTNSQQDAEDLCADVFVKVYAKLDSFDENKASLSTWIFHITRNTLFDFFRKGRSTVELDENIPQEGDFSEDICREEALEALADALESLPERERNIVLLHYYKRIPLKTIAEQLDLSYSYTKLLHNQSVEKIRKKLERTGFLADSFV